MNEKCEKLLKQINLNEEYFSFFNNATLDKIVGNSNKDSYVFMLSLENILPVNIYSEMNDGLKQAFINIPKKEFNFDVKNIDYSMVEEYYKYFIDKLSEKNHLFSSLDDAEISLDGNTLNVLVSNIAEKNLLLNSCDILIKKLKNIGFKDIKIEVGILEKEVDQKYYLSQKIKPTILSDGSAGFKSKSEIDQVIARPLTASMHKMHRACQDNYYSDLFIQSEGKQKPSEEMTKDELAHIAIRKLTPREAFMLQGFPNDFSDKAREAGVANGAMYKQAGNAVSVNVIYAVLFYLISNKIIIK